MGPPNPRKIIIIVALSSFAFLLGVITGYFSRPIHKDSSEKLLDKLNRDGDLSLFEQFKEFVGTGYIDKVIRDLTRRPGLAGTPQQKPNAEYILDLWQQQGLKAEIVQYKVLLPYPKGNHTNKVSLYDASGRELFTSKPHEKASCLRQNLTRKRWSTKKHRKKLYSLVTHILQRVCKGKVNRSRFKIPMTHFDT